MQLHLRRGQALWLVSANQRSSCFKQRPCAGAFSCLSWLWRTHRGAASDAYVRGSGGTRLDRHSWRIVLHRNRRRPYLFIVTVKDVLGGNELLVDYGLRYWEGHSQVQKAQQFTNSVREGLLRVHRELLKSVKNTKLKERLSRVDDEDDYRANADGGVQDTVEYNTPERRPRTPHESSSEESEESEDSEEDSDDESGSEGSEETDESGGSDHESGSESGADSDKEESDGSGDVAPAPEPVPEPEPAFKTKAKAKPPRAKPAAGKAPKPDSAASIPLQSAPALAKAPAKQVAARAPNPKVAKKAVAPGKQAAPHTDGPDVAAPAKHPPSSTPSLRKRRKPDGPDPAAAPKANGKRSKAAPVATTKAAAAGSKRKKVSASKPPDIRSFMSAKANPPPKQDTSRAAGPKVLKGSRAAGPKPAKRAKSAPAKECASCGTSSGRHPLSSWSLREGGRRMCTAGTCLRGGVGVGCGWLPSSLQ